MSRKKTTTIQIIVEGPILPGSVSTATARCGKKSCRCQANPPQLHGPYFRWTGVIDGHRTTITISEDEFKECERRISNYRRLQEKLDNLIEKALNHAPWMNR